MTKPLVEQLKQAIPARYSIESRIEQCSITTEYRGRDLEGDCPVKISALDPQYLGEQGVRGGGGSDAAFDRRRRCRPAVCRIC